MISCHFIFLNISKSGRNYAAIIFQRNQFFPSYFHLHRIDLFILQKVGYRVQNFDRKGCFTVSLFHPHFQKGCFTVSLFHPYFGNSCFTVSLFHGETVSLVSPVSPDYFFYQIRIFFSTIFTS